MFVTAWLRRCHIPVCLARKKIPVTGRQPGHPESRDFLGLKFRTNHQTPDRLPRVRRRPGEVAVNKKKAGR